MTNNEESERVTYHLEQATKHLTEANQQLEDSGYGTGFIGEEHMSECLWALKQLVEARGNVDE